MTKPRPLLTIAEVAHFLNVSKKSVYSLPIPHMIVGHRRRYRLSDVEAYLRGEIDP